MELCFKLIIGLLLVTSSLSLFSNSPTYQYYTNGQTPTKLKISPDESSLIIGYANGYARIYSLSGYNYYSMYDHNYKIVDVQWTRYYGPITLDSSGKAIRWTNTGYQSNVWYLNSTAYDMAVSDDSYTSYVAFNLGTKIVEYYVSSGIYVRTYYPPNGTTFSKIQYSSNHNYIFASQSNGYVQLYSTSSGTSMNYNIYVSYPITSFSRVQSGYSVIAMTNTYGYVYKITSGGSLTSIKYLGSSKDLVACPSKSLFAVAQSSFADIAIYDLYSGNFQQYLTYMSGSGLTLDCSTNYLASADYYGYVYITSDYYSTFPIWAIVLITVGGCLICVAVIVISCVRMIRRKRVMQGMDTYNKVDIISTNQPYFPPNQGYGNNVDQGYNPPSNQGFNNGPNNPYQANQPRNWS